MCQYILLASTNHAPANKYCIVELYIKVLFFASLVSCPSLTAPNNGMINCTGNMSGDPCTFSCDQGYELSGNETRTCQINTTWSGDDVTCTPGTYVCMCVF